MWLTRIRSSRRAQLGIAAALGCSMGTVKSRLFYALEKLRGMNALTEQRGNLNEKVKVP